MSTAKDRFNASLKRCDSLVESARTGNCDTREQLRFSVVLAVAAFDSYVADRFAEHFVAFVKESTTNAKVVSFLEKISFGMEEALSLLCAKKDRPFRTIRTAVDRYLSHQSFQSAKPVNELFSLYGLPNLFEDATQKAGGKSPRKLINDMIRRRHEIVHACDYNGRGNLRPLDIATVEQWMKSLNSFVDSMDLIVNNRFERSPKRKKSRKDKLFRCHRKSIIGTTKA